MAPGCVGERPSEALGARAHAVALLGSHADDVVELGSRRLVERLIGDL